MITSMSGVVGQKGRAVYQFINSLFHKNKICSRIKGDVSIRINYDLIPKSIADRRISLKGFGIAEYAWNAEDIKKIVNIFNENRIPILGGDVYKIVDGKVCKTYDSWYINRTDEYDFCDRSHERTISYILSYEERNRGQFVYSIVF